MVGAQGLGDGAHGSAVVSVLHVTQALLCLGKLLQAVQPEVEVLRRHAGPQTLVQLAGELVASLRIDDNMSGAGFGSTVSVASAALVTPLNSNK